MLQHSAAATLLTPSGVARAAGTQALHAAEHLKRQETKKQKSEQSRLPTKVAQVTTDLTTSLSPKA